MGPSSTLPSGYESYCSRGVLHVGCMGSSVVAGLTTGGVLVVGAARPCLMQWQLAHWWEELGSGVAGCGSWGWCWCAGG